MAYVRQFLSVPSWATALKAVEALGEEPRRPEVFEVETAQTPEVVIATLSIAGRGPVPESWPVGKLHLQAFEGLNARSESREFRAIESLGPIYVLDDYVGFRHWRLEVEPESEHLLEVNFLAIHPHAHHELRRKSPSRSAPTLRLATPKNWPCEACKLSVGALAIAIAAAAALSSIPATLISAVAVFLGVAIPVAQAILQYLFGKSVEAIAEHLCEQAGFCP